MTARVFVEGPTFAAFSRLEEGIGGGEVERLNLYFVPVSTADPKPP